MHAARSSRPSALQWLSSSSTTATYVGVVGEAMRTVGFGAKCRLLPFREGLRERGEDARVLRQPREFRD